MHILTPPMSMSLLCFPLSWTLNPNVTFSSCVTLCFARGHLRPLALNTLFTRLFVPNAESAEPILFWIGAPASFLLCTAPCHIFSSVAEAKFLFRSFVSMYFDAGGDSLIAPGPGTAAQVT